LEYGQRFLRGFVFSSVIGPVFGLINAAAQLLYPAFTIQITKQIFPDAQDIHSDNIEYRIGVFIGALGVAILYNLIAGAIFSSIMAAIFRPSKDQEVEIVKKELYPIHFELLQLTFNK